MPSKSLKASVTLTPDQTDQIEDALVFLSDRYLKATKTTCRVVQTPTDFCLVDLCKPLVEGWISGKVSYAKGKISLLFRSGHLSAEADMIVYAPLRGDRFLYTKPQSQPTLNDQLTLSFEPPSELNSAAFTESSPHPMQYLIHRQQALEDKLDQLLASHIPPSIENPFVLDDDEPLSSSVNGIQSPSADFLDALVRRLNDQLTQKIRDNLTAALQPLHHQITELQDQIGELSERIDELETLGFDDGVPIPQSRDEWLERIEQTWGTVGDYERYNAAYREANAETPLHETPDWVALCELDWAREMCPELAILYSLIHTPDGIGYEGADILQQFGQHTDPKTGEPYYLYRHNGFTALDALQQLVYNSDHSWLAELKALWFQLGRPDHPIFQLFGWEADAIAALKAIATQTQQSQRSHSWDYRQPWHGTTQDPSIKEYRATLNLGPFTPITLEGVKRAYREAMKTAHPDSGGTTEYAQRVNEAYNAVMRHYFPETT